MSAGKAAAVLIFILLLVWLVLLTLGNLGLIPGSTQKYVKDRKWDKMREMLEDLHDADGTEDPTVCKDIREWWEDNQEDYDAFIAGQEDGDPETLNDWSSGFPVEIEFKDFIKEYFEKVGKEFAEGDFLEIAKDISWCEDEVDLSKFKENVVRIINTTPVEGYNAIADGDCSNVTTEQSLLPNYVWSYDDDTFIDISGLEDTEINSTGWRKKHKMICTPITMNEEFIPGIGAIPAKIKFTGVSNAIKDTVITIAEHGTNNLTGLTYTLPRSDINEFEIDIANTIRMDKPIYVIKLDGKETDHAFAGNVGTIAFKETKAAKLATPNLATDDINYVAEADATPAEYDYKILEFTPNIDIPAGYEIIVETSEFPTITTYGQKNPHSCPTGVTDPKIVAKIQSTTANPITKVGGSQTLTQEWCYGTEYKTVDTPGTQPDPYNARDYIPATYTAYIRETKTSTVAEDPENPQHKFATLTLGKFCDASTAPTNGVVGTCTDKLASGSWCRPTCIGSYTLSGKSSCTNGVLTAATCSASSST